MALRALVMLALGACIEPEIVECGDHACPVGFACTARSCLAPGDVVVCLGAHPDCTGDRAIVLTATEPLLASSLELAVRSAAGEVVRTVAGEDGVFTFVDIGDIAGFEVVLRDAGGAIIAHGRAPATVRVGQGPVSTDVRRPLGYVAGRLLRQMPDQMPDEWRAAPATSGDLSRSGFVDGARVGAKVAVMIAAGAKLVAISQEPNMTGIPSGIAEVAVVEDQGLGLVANLPVGASVRVGAGTLDGKLVVVGTSSGLYVVDLASGEVSNIATGPIDRVAIAEGSDGGRTVVAISNRSSITCDQATLLAGDLGGPVALVATGSFIDVATDGARMFAAGRCGGELFEIAGGTVTTLRSDLGNPSALVVRGERAFVTTEENSGGLVTIASALIDGGAAPQVLWSERVRQQVFAPDLEAVNRDLVAASVRVDDLVLLAGGHLLATTHAATYIGKAVPQARFPRLTITTNELRVFDAATGAVVLRHRGWCDGLIEQIGFDDIDFWECGLTAGQTGPQRADEHLFDSLAVPFGYR